MSEELNNETINNETINNESNETICLICNKNIYAEKHLCQVRNLNTGILILNVTSS